VLTLGYFHTAEEASEAYEAARRLHHSKFNPEAVE
jgi:hypothetical protein